MEKNTNCTDIIFRSKFTKHIQCDVEHDVFICAFKKFIALDKSSAIDIIWRMSCTPCSEELWKISLDPETIPEEMYTALRSELRHQYEKFHRSSNQDSCAFWTDGIELPEEAKTHLMDLSIQTNIVVAAVVYQKCNTYLLSKSVEQIERVLFLLDAIREQLHYGGLCELRFDSKESNYLKTFHEKIYNLLNVMFENRREQKSALTQKPFETLAQQIEDTGNDLPFYLRNEDNEAPEESIPEEIPADDPICNTSLFNAITAENVLKYKDIFSSFAIARDMSCLIHLSKLGFDLNEVVAKEKAISTFIEAATALSV